MTYLNNAQVLLVRPLVARVLKHDVGRAGFHHGSQDLRPQVARLDRGSPNRRLRLVRLVRLVELLELVPVAVGQVVAVFRAEESPVAVGLDALHEEVGHPQREKQVC